MSLAWSSVKALSIPVGGTARDVKRVTAGGVVLWEKAPALPYDAEVEYIESTGTQYIDTGVTSDFSVSISMSFRPSNSGVRPFGADDFRGGIQRRQWVAIGSNGLSVVYNCDQSGAQNIQIVSANSFLGTDVALSASGVSLSALGASVSAPGWTPTTGSGCTIGLFAGKRIDANGNTVWVVPASMRLYSATLVQNGATIRDFRPVRVGSGASAVGCLYDKLGTGGQNPDGSARNDGLYFNRGSGAFVVGPDET